MCKHCPLKGIKTDIPLKTGGSLIVKLIMHLKKTNFSDMGGASTTVSKDLETIILSSIIHFFCGNNGVYKIGPHDQQFASFIG